MISDAVLPARYGGVTATFPGLAPGMYALAAYHDENGNGGPQRKGKKLSNQDWVSKSDPEAKIAKMKDGTTHSLQDRILFGIPRGGGRVCLQQRRDPPSFSAPRRILGRRHRTHRPGHS